MARIPEVIRRNPVSQVSAQAPQAGQGFAALAQLAKIGEDFVRPKALEQSREAGENAVYRDANGALQIDERSVLGGEMADAHNAAGYAKYLAQKQIDVAETFTEMARQHEFDPTGFQAAADAYVQLNEQDENIPRALKEGLLASIREESQRRFNGLQNSEIDRTRSDANRNTTASRNMMVDDYTNLFVGGNLEAAEAKLAEIQAITDFRVNSGYISESEVEGEAFIRGVRGAAVAAGLARNLENLSGESSITSEYRAEIIESLNDPNIDPAVRARLYTATQGVLKGVDAAAIVAGLTDTSFMASLNRANNPDFTNAVGGYTGGNESQTQFIQDMMPAAIAASERTGVDPRIIIAQAIQETGWGEHAPNNNYFGIKSHGQSGGSNLTTTEVINGETVTIQDNFRGYADMAASVEGYADFLLENPRYKAMMEAQGLDAQIEALGASGYATDPNYAASIASIAGSITMDGVPVATPANNRTREQNLTVFERMDLPVTPANEYLGMTFGMQVAVPILQARPDEMLSDILTDYHLEQFPELADMSVSQVMNQANRAMTTKASDMAAQKIAIDRIPDTEVRAMASANLADQVQTQQRIENQTAADYAVRLEAGDDTLTVQEIMQDHGLSDAAQRSLVAKLNKKNEARIEQQQTVLNLNDPNFVWDAYNTSQINAIDDVFVATIDGADPITDPDAQDFAYQIAEEAGFIPKTMFNALRGAVNSGDPARLAAAMKFTGQVLDVQPNAIGPYGGRTDVQNALSDYRFYAEFGSAEEAAARVIELQQADPPKNVRDVAKDAAERLSINDIVDHYDDSMWSDPNAGNAVEQGAMMAEYSRLFTDEYMATGEASIARNRALDQIGRVYGPNVVTGSQRIMKFPPQNFYPAVNGSQDWMQQQLESDLSVAIFGEDARQPLFDSVSLVDVNWVRSSDIRLVSDAQTRAEVIGGQAPSYQVFYTDNDGMTQVVPQRYRFDPAAVAFEMNADSFAEGKENNNANEAIFQGRVDQMGTFMDGLPQGDN